MKMEERKGKHAVIFFNSTGKPTGTIVMTPAESRRFRALYNHARKKSDRAALPTNLVTTIGTEVIKLLFHLH